MIEYEKRAMIEAEDKYTFRQSTQISMQTGLIGHLRADMDTDGNGFFSSWFDFREELKTDEFKAEFDDVINSLREEGDILHNRRALAKYCYCTPQSRMQGEPGYYGVRVDTEKYAYLLRLNPDRGEYNLYCYCYRRDWLDQHLKDAEKGIRFIDSHYKELFRMKTRFAPAGISTITKWRSGATSITFASLPSAWNTAAIPTSRFGTTCPSGATAFFPAATKSLSSSAVKRATSRRTFPSPTRTKPGASRMSIMQSSASAERRKKR